MKVVIVGAGLLGLTTAWYLKKQGVEVVVLEKNKDVALELSFANGGQISVSYSEPWSNFSNLKKMLSWIGKEDSPLLFKPQLDINQWLWGMNFIMECFPNKNKENIKSLVKLSMFSRRKLQELRGELDLQYNQLSKGILTFYTTEESFIDGQKSAKFMESFGCNRKIKSLDECYQIEPILKNSQIKIFGGDFTEGDESGDAYLFAKELKKKCIEFGVEFIFNSEVKDLIVENDSLKGVVYVQNENRKVMYADKFVMALGAKTGLLLSKYNINTNIYPTKGYSATINILDDSKVNKVSLTDSNRKTVITKIGNKVRVAGTAEFNGFNEYLNPKRCNLLIDIVKDLIPEGLDYNNVDFWTGFRPSTPSNVPLIGRAKINNLYINSGHGTLGWTMAVGSGQILTDLLLNKKTILEDNIVC